jgi:allophanate hydrolase subunit 2
MAAKVIKPGLSTTVQDLGRPGYYNIGIPISGGMDRFALRAANMLVGNKEGLAVLEAVFMGPELEFTEDVTVAVTGAELPPKVNGEARPTWTSFKVKKGQVLSFDYLKKAGPVPSAALMFRWSGVALDLYAGALAAEGRKLWKATGSRLEGPGCRKGGGVSESRLPGAPAQLRMIPGLYWHRITAEAGRHFLADTWKVAPEADRIGYRFKGGRALDFVPRTPPFGAGSDPSNIVDACYPMVPSRFQVAPNPSCSPRCGFRGRLLHGRRGDLG